MIRTALVRILGVAGVGAMLLAPVADMTAQTPTTYEGSRRRDTGRIGQARLPRHQPQQLRSQGSLRDALSQGNRTVVFDVGGDIVRLRRGHA